MVYNVLRDIGATMPRHAEMIKIMYRIDSVKKELDQWHDLMSKLIEEPDENYASHMNTGIVYDKRVIADNLDRLKQEMTDLEERLNEQ